MQTRAVRLHAGSSKRMSDVLQRANALSGPVASSQVSVSTSMRVPPPMRRQVTFEAVAKLDQLFRIFAFADSPKRIFAARRVCKCARPLM